MHSPAELLILDRAQVDLEEGLAYVRERLREHARGHPAMVGRAMELSVAGAVSMLQLRPRHREDVQILLGLAHRVNAGEDPQQLAREHLPRVLRMRELALVARTKEPAFQTVLELAENVLAARLPDLARMVAVEAPRDYADLVRRAFPDPAYVVGFVEENRRALLSIVDHLERNPRILRVPSGWVASIAGATRDIIEWETDRIRESVRGIYGTDKA